jgi:hypothetical protein
VRVRWTTGRVRVGAVRCTAAIGTSAAMGAGEVRGAVATVRRGRVLARAPRRAFAARFGAVRARVAGADWGAGVVATAAGVAVTGLATACAAAFLIWPGA